MSTYATITSLIRQQFVTGWGVLQPSIPYYFDGQDIDKDLISNRTWVRMSILLGESSQVAMGGGTTGRRVRTVGIAEVRLFKPSGGGHGELYRLADSVASVWQLSTMDGILYRAASAQAITTDGPWVILPVQTPFQADEYVT